MNKAAHKLCMVSMTHRLPVPLKKSWEESLDLLHSQRSSQISNPPPRLHLPSTKIIGLHHYIQFKSSENQTGLHVCACQVSTLLSTKKASCHPSFSPTDTLPHKVSTVYPGWPQTLEFKWSSCLSIPNYCNFGHVPILIFGFFLLLLYL